MNTTTRNTTTMKITIIEDDPIIRRELKILLENALYAVDAPEDFIHAAETILLSRPDLVLLDLNLPGITGFEICTQIRAKADIPIIFLTSRTDSMDELTAILKGGDDYIRKPYQAPILLARIAAVLKRTSRSVENEPDSLTVKGVRLDILQARLFYRNDRGDESTDLVIDLTKTEFRIMYFLFKHAGEIVPRMDLIEYLWDNQVFIDDNTLSVNVTRIREKLKAAGITSLIETKRGMGYRV